ncbi:MAG: tetratricopeptide repeat protein [Bacteroidota bacterium]|nr:tetratricopeptide repeat protein [Bacteroidota bacterium]
MKKPVDNKLRKLWRELKRRNVIRVITVYAAAAFVILELVSIIVEPLRLPEWTLPLIIVLLCVGFVIAVILSWIYDLTPEGIERTESAKEPAENIPDRPSRQIGWKVATIISLVLIAGLVLLNIFKNNGRSGDIRKLEKSIAVLPFHYYNVNPEAEDIGDAFSNEIITQLYKVRGFDRIISHTSTLRYKGPDMPSMPVIGDELDVNFIIEGSLERQDEDVSIQVQIVRADTDDHIWADEFKGKWNDIFKIRASIAKNVASELKTILSQSEIELIEEEPTDNLEAYDFYLLGNQYRQKGSEENYLKAIDLYKSALDLDPEFALAWVGIGNSYRGMFFNANWLPEEAYEKSRAAVLRALKIDNQLAEAHLALARVKYEYDWDLEAAEREFKKAFELNPNLAEAYAYYGDLLNLKGDSEESQLYFKKALMLNPNPPNSVRYQTFMGYSYLMAGKEDSAIIVLKQIAYEHPHLESPQRFLGAVYISSGEYDKAIEMMERAVEINSVAHSNRLLLGIAYARAGLLDKTREQLELLDGLEDETSSISFPRAALLAELGQVDSAMYWLGKAYEERNQWVLYLKVYDFFFTTIRSDPRFIEFYNKIWPGDE